MSLIRIKLPIGSLGRHGDEVVQNYNIIKTNLIRRFEIFSFEMKRSAKMLEIDVEYLDTKIEDDKILVTIYKCLNSNDLHNIGKEYLDHSYVNFLDFSHHCESCDLKKTLRISGSEPTRECSKIQKCIDVFSSLNMKLFKILYFSKLNRIQEDYNCKISYSDSTIKIEGTEKCSVNTCARSILDLYYSNVLLETVGNFSYPETPIIEIIRSNKNSQVFGSLKSLGGLESTKKCFLSLTVPSETGNFICGKKMGKIFKIDSSILQVFYTNENTIFKMTGLAKECLRCYTQLFDEFPHEMCFYIDRKLHKKIIGMDGCIIQRIMKKYNFYVKFLNSKEAENMDLEGNVILRTPRKNKDVLEEAKSEIYNLGIGEKCVPSANIELEVNKDMKDEIFNLEGIGMLIEMCIKKKRQF